MVQSVPQAVRDKLPWAGDYMPLTASPICLDGMITIPQQDTLTEGQKSDVLAWPVRNDSVVAIVEYSCELYDAETYAKLSDVAAFRKLSWYPTNNGKLDVPYRSSFGTFGTALSAHTPYSGFSVFRPHRQGNGTPPLLYTGKTAGAIQIRVNEPIAGAVIGEAGWLAVASVQGWSFGIPDSNNNQRIDLLEQIKKAVSEVLQEKAYAGLLGRR